MIAVGLPAKLLFIFDLIVKVLSLELLTSQSSQQKFFDSSKFLFLEYFWVVYEKLEFDDMNCII
jgi:hypothetical protein